MTIPLQRAPGMYNLAQLPYRLDFSPRTWGCGQVQKGRLGWRRGKASGFPQGTHPTAVRCVAISGRKFLCSRTCPSTFARLQKRT